MPRRGYPPICTAPGIYSDAAWTHHWRNRKKRERLSGHGGKHASEWVAAGIVIGPIGVAHRGHDVDTLIFGCGVIRP